GLSSPAIARAIHRITHPSRYCRRSGSVPFHPTRREVPRMKFLRPTGSLGPADWLLPHAVQRAREIPAHRRHLAGAAKGIVGASATTWKRVLSCHVSINRKPRSGSLMPNENSLFGRIISLFCRKFSLFDRVGNSIEKTSCYRRLAGSHLRQRCAKLKK